jgi:MFS family permease
VGLRDVLRREFSFISGNFRILVLSWVVMDLAMEMPSPNFQYYVQALGGTGMVLGIIGFANFLGIAAVAFPGGYLADKYGRRWLISTMTFGMSLSYLFFALAPSWHFILLGSIVNSLCLIYQPALFAMVQDSLPPERRGMGSSIIQLIHGTFNTPGPLIAGFLLLQFGLVTSMRIVYLIVTLLFLTAAVLRLRLKEVMTKGEPIRFSYFISSYPKAIRESFSVWKVVPRSMWWLFVVQTFVMFGIALTQVINAIYARDVLLIPEKQWWLVYIPLLLTLVVASIPIGKMVDKFGRKTPMVIGLLVLGASTLLFVTANLPIAMISMCLLAIGQLLGMSTVMALATDLVPPANRGKVNGFINFISSIMMGFGMLLGNYLYVNFFPQLPFYLTAALIVPEVLVVLFLVHEPEKRVGDT